MFSRITQLSKNITDEFSRINDDVSTNRKAQGQPTIDPVSAQKILNTQTPDPETITKPEELNKLEDSSDQLDEPQSPDPDSKSGTAILDTTPPVETAATVTLGEDTESRSSVSISQSRVSSPVPADSKQGTDSLPPSILNPNVYVPGTNIRYNDLPIDIRNKLRKFVKYEDKYPALFEAYKIEKKKTSIISSFEKILQEATPCSGIGEAESFKEYLSSLTSKNEMLSNELRKASAYENSLTKDKKELIQKLRDLQAELTTLQEEKSKEIETGEDAEETNKEEIDSLKKQISELEQSLAKLGESKDQLQSQLDAKDKELLEKETAFLKTIADLKAQNGNLTSELEASNADLQKVTENLNSANETIEKKTSGEKDLKESLQSLNNDLLASKKSSEQEIETLNTKISDLQSTVESKDKLTQAFREKVNALTEELNTAAARPDITEASRPQNAGTSSSKSNNKKKNKNKNKNKSQAEPQLEETEKEISEENTKETQTVLESNGVEVIELKHNYESLKEKFDKLILSQTGLEEKYKHISSEYESHKERSEDVLNSAQAECTQLKQELKAKNEEVENLKDMLRDLGDDLVTCKDELKQARGNFKSVESLESELQSKTQELDSIKNEMEVLRVQNSSSITDYEATKASLVKKLDLAIKEKTDAHNDVTNLTQDLKRSSVQLETLKDQIKEKNSDIIKLNKEITSLQQDNDKLTNTADILTKEKAVLETKNKELSEFQTSDAQLKLDLASLKTSLNRKTKVITENESRIKYLQEEKTKLNDTLIELKVNVSELNSQNNLFEKTKNSLVTKNENLKQEYNDLMLKLNKVSTENNKLMKNIEELTDKYNDVKDLKSNSTSQIDLIKRRCDELSMINKEYENRVDSLEVELSEARSMLQERTRESGTIRKMMIENEESQSAKVKDLNAKLLGLTEEKERRENETTLSLKKKQRELDDLKMKFEELKTDLEETTAVKNMLEAKIEALSSEITKKNESRQVRDASNKLLEDEDDLNLSHKLIESLRESLNSSEHRVRDLESLNTVLKTSSEDASQKLIRLNKKYKLLSQQLRKHYADDSGPSSPVSSRKNSLVNLPMYNGQSSVMPMDGAVSKDRADETKDKAEYIKNVLLGFLEHKEQRSILLPVIKALLYLSDDDEKKFVSLLSKT